MYPPAGLIGCGKHLLHDDGSRVEDGWFLNSNTCHEAGVFSLKEGLVKQ